MAAKKRTAAGSREKPVARHTQSAKDKVAVRGRLSARERAALQWRHRLRTDDEHLSDAAVDRRRKYNDTEEPKDLRSKLAQNLRVMLTSKESGKDSLMAVVGGLMYVVLPTLIEGRLGAGDLTGWRGYATSVGLNVFLGALLRSPGYLSGTLGAAAAHLLYARGQDKIIVPWLGKFAYRFDPTVTTSSMSDSMMPMGTEERTIAGERVMLYPPSPVAPRIVMEQLPGRTTEQLPKGADMSAMQPAAALSGGASTTGTSLLQENFSPTLQENFSRTLQENSSGTLQGAISQADREQLQNALRDNFSQTLQDAYSAWGTSMRGALDWK